MTTAATPTEAGRPLTAPLAVPRIAPQRRWRPALLWLGVALVIVGGLISWRVFSAVGTTEQYLAVSQRVEFGAQLTRDDLTVVRINRDPSLRPVRATEVEKVLNLRAAMPLAPGTLLTAEQLTEETIPGSGQQLVGLGLPQNRVPADRVKPGAKVLLVVTSDDSPVTGPQKTPAAPASVPATVIDVQPGSKEGETLLNVAVAERDGPLVASRAAEGRIVVVLTQRG